MLGGAVVLLVVHAVDERAVDVDPGGRDDDLLGASREVHGGLVARPEHAGALEDDVDAELAPGQLRGIALGRGADDLVADAKPALHGLGVVPAAVHRVVLQQVREHVVGGEIVDVDELDVVAVPARTKDVAPDPAEAVDADLDAHGDPSRGGVAGCLFGFRTQVKHAVTGGKTGLDGAGRSLLSVLVPNVRIEDPDADPTVELARRLDVSEDMILAWTLVRRSLDGRHRKQVWRGVYKVDVVDEEAVLAKHTGLRAWMDRDDERYGLVDGGPAAGLTWPVGTRVLVVGAGPAGLFAALYLAEAGADVVLFDRGGPVKDRVKQVNGFWRGKRQLDPENNLVFGEGGAGTFSDGKIYTRRRDGEVGYILRRFVRFGARPEILEEGWAHLGTDQVRAILPQFRARLAELGVEVRYHTRVDDLVVEGGRAVGVALADGAVVRGSHVMFAPGHSARDTLWSGPA